MSVATDIDNRNEGDGELDAGALAPFLPAVREDITDAIHYFTNEIKDDLEDGVRYYNGAVDLPTNEGRSKAVSTQVRDAIRNIKPSIMRVLCGATSIVKYTPTNIQVAAIVEQQEAYIHQLFWANNGYRLILDMVDESLKMKMCPIKTYWSPNVSPTYAQLTMLTQDEVMALELMPDVEILNIEENETPIGEMVLYDIEVEQTHINGKICSDPVPVNEFFISRNSTCVEDARVHGHQRSVTVSEAIELGLEYAFWEDLDDAEDETRLERKDKQTANKNEEDRGDILSHRFLLTEAYLNIDLEDAGSDQLYCVYFGGTDRTYLGHYRETESPFDVAQHDPVPFSVHGTSIPELTIPTQNVMSSLLRSTIDNAHAANHPRLAGDPQKVNFDDVTNHDIAHPIRMKMGAQIQVVAIPSTLQGSLPLLQWMETDQQQKLGITKAAQGLDPDALQSTDKDAVKNTIMLSQGQVELMVRNLIQTGIIPLFRKMLRLSIQHMDRVQIVRMRGQYQEVDQLLFDPNLYAKPQVGLGATSDEQRAMGLQFTLQQQMGIIERMGMDNPFVSVSHVYNTLEDLTKIFGLHNVGRYYNLVSPEVEKQYVEQKKKEMAAAAQAQQPTDPAMALVEGERIKAGVEKFKIIAGHRAKLYEQQYRALEANAKDDLERDRMAQERELRAAEVLGKFGIQADQNLIKREQQAPRDNAPIPLKGNSQ